MMTDIVENFKDHLRKLVSLNNTWLIKELIKLAGDAEREGRSPQIVKAIDQRIDMTESEHLDQQPPAVAAAYHTNQLTSSQTVDAVLDWQQSMNTPVFLKDIPTNDEPSSKIPAWQQLPVLDLMNSMIQQLTSYRQSLIEKMVDKFCLVFKRAGGSTRNELYQLRKRLKETIPEEQLFILDECVRREMEPNWPKFEVKDEEAVAQAGSRVQLPADEPSKENQRILHYLGSIAPDMSANDKKKSANATDYAALQELFLEPKVVHRETIKLLFGEFRLTELLKQKRAIDFLYAFTVQHFFVLHACTPDYERNPVAMLQPGETRESPKRWYGDTLRDLGFTAVGESRFFKISKEQMSSDEMDRPMTTQCNVCRLHLKNVRSSELTPEEKIRTLVEHQMPHLDMCIQGRQHYNTLVKDAEAAIKDAKISKLSKHEANTSEMQMHYSFDVAEKVQYPKGAKQKRKCEIFGVCCEGIPQQINYLIDEGVYEKNIDTNLIVCLLHHFFDNYGLGEKTVHLHCDNCGGQNKNNLMLRYLAWRVMEGKHQEITLNFMPAAHSKFYPDLNFRRIKQRLEKEAVHSVKEIAKEVEASRKRNINRAHVVSNDEQSGTILDGKWFPAERFRRFDGMKEFHYFHFSSLFPGKVHCQKKLNDQFQVFDLRHSSTCESPAQQGWSKFKDSHTNDFDQLWEHHKPSERRTSIAADEVRRASLEAEGVSGPRREGYVDSQPIFNVPTGCFTPKRPRLTAKTQIGQGGPRPGGPGPRMAGPRPFGPRGPTPNVARPVKVEEPKIIPGSPMDDPRWSCMRGLLEKEVMEEVVIDGKPYEVKMGLQRNIRAYGRVCEVYPDPNERGIRLDGKIIYKFGEPKKDVDLGHRMVELFYHGPPLTLWIDGQQHRVRLDAPPFTMTFDGTLFGFQIDGRDKMILVDRMEKGVLGGPPRPLMLNDIKHEIAFEAPARNILIDQQSCELKLDRKIPLIIYNGKPHGIRFEGGPRKMIIDDTAYLVPLDSAVKAMIGNRPHFLAFGGPAHEIIIDGKWFEVKFNNVPKNIAIGNRIHSIRLEPPIPMVKILYEITQGMDESDLPSLLGQAQPGQVPRMPQPPLPPPVLTPGAKPSVLGRPPRPLLLNDIKHEIAFEAPARNILIDQQSHELKRERKVPLNIYSGKHRGIPFWKAGPSTELPAVKTEPVDSSDVKPAEVEMETEPTVKAATTAQQPWPDILQQNQPAFPIRSGLGNKKYLNPTMLADIFPKLDTLALQQMYYTAMINPQKMQELLSMVGQVQMTQGPQQGFPGMPSQHFVGTPAMQRPVMPGMPMSTNSMPMSANNMPMSANAHVCQQYAHACQQYGHVCQQYGHVSQQHAHLCQQHAHHAGHCTHACRRPCPHAHPNPR